MTKPKNDKRSLIVGIFQTVMTAIVAGGSATAFAQDDTSVDEEIYELSPFVVDTTDRKSTRLNSSHYS